MRSDINHPLLNRLQKSKSLTGLAILGYVLVPILMIAYYAYTSVEPTSRLTIASDTNGNYPLDHGPNSYASYTNDTPTPEPKPTPQPKPVKRKTNNPIHLASSAQTNETKPEPRADQDKKKDKEENSEEQKPVEIQGDLPKPEETDPKPETNTNSPDNTATDNPTDAPVTLPL